MSYDFPADIDDEIRRFAAAKHISMDAAVIRLVESALRTRSAGQAIHGERSKMGPGPGESLIGLFASDANTISQISRDARDFRDREAVREINA